MVGQMVRILVKSRIKDRLAETTLTPLTVLTADEDRNEKKKRVSPPSILFD